MVQIASRLVRSYKMTKIKTYQNSNNEDCVFVDNEDGTTWSGLKSAYDAQQDTLASESNPTGGNN